LVDLLLLLHAACFGFFGVEGIIRFIYEIFTAEKGVTRSLPILRNLLIAGVVILVLLLPLAVYAHIEMGRDANEGVVLDYPISITYTGHRIR
jgi:ABC-type phosphate transport system permease subunit